MHPNVFPSFYEMNVRGNLDNLQNSLSGEDEIKEEEEEEEEGNLEMEV